MRDVSTSLDMTGSLLEDRRTLWVVAALIVVLFAIANLPWQLDDYDQAKQAFISFEMVKESHWLYQHTPHEGVATKPPLVGWISAAFFTVTRSWEIAWRLPSLVAALALAIVLFRAANDAYGTVAAIIALSAFGLNLVSPRLATLVRTDMPLALAIFLIWVAGGIRFHPGFHKEVVMREFVGRFGETIHRPQPLLFYLPHLLHKFAPWSVLMVVIAFFGLRLRNWRLRSVFREMFPETFWLLCWSIGGLIVMSLIPSKRVDRIFPVIPPLCLLLAAQVTPRNSCSHGPMDYPSRSVGSAETGHRPVVTKDTLTPIYRWSTGALLLAILFTGGYTGWKVITGYRDHRNALAIFGRNVRHEAEVRHWRYEIVSAKDEGLLLYLRKTHFIQPTVAVTEWDTESLDALVASKEKAAVLMRDLSDAALSQLQLNEREHDQQGRGYVLITR